MKVLEAQSEKGQNQALDVRKQVFVNEQLVPIELEIDEYDKTASHFVLYDKDEKPVGAARLRFVDSYGKAERVCVLSSYRRSGAGRLLMEALEKKATKEGASSMKLNAQMTAVPFYERLGYSVTSNEFMDASIPHVEMKKALPIGRDS